MRQRLKMLSIAAIFGLSPVSGFADSRCVSLQANTVVNDCGECADVTVRELLLPAQQASGPFSGITRTVRLEGKSRQVLETGGSWMISALKACR